MARTNARVRVLQNNAVILEQNVPPGPFELPELNPISSVGNLQVVVSEADGSEQRFVVPFSISMGKLNPGSYRYSVATGLYRNFTSTQNTQVVHAVRWLHHQCRAPSLSAWGSVSKATAAHRCYFAVI